MDRRTIACILRCGLALGAALAIAGCGYTILEHPHETAAGAGDDDMTPEEAELPPAGDQQIILPEEGPVEELILPPGHPLIIEPQDWVGRSFLDDIVGEADPLRFENVRAHLEARTTFENATLRIRVTIGGPAIFDIWQIRMDEFGWVTTAHWTQGQAGPEIDESLATDRVEFRLERESESALRTMMINLLPQAPYPDRVIRPRRLGNIPRDLWPYEEPGLIEIDYHYETLDTLSPDQWPGGRLSAPLDMIQILIGTWHGPPPADLHAEVWALAQDRPLLLNLGLLIEGIVLAWEVEGRDQERIDLPLWIGR